MSFRLKQLVSKEKRRFEEDGFNLDLTYVTNRLIAFGYPAESFEGIYRNHYKDVYNFFERRHGANYRIYNLCSERCYDKEKFHCRVGEYRFDDHCPPPLALFRPFCEDVQAWLEKDPEHVVAIHCKAGKGRTGVMICAYMIYIGLWASAHGAMEFFGSARSKKGEGVTIPSQRRFIQYFEAMCRNGRRSSAMASSSADEFKRNSDEDSSRADRERDMSATEYTTQWEEAIEGRGLALFMPRLPRPAPILPPSVKLALTRIRICGVYSHKRMDPRIRIECGQDVHEFEGPFNYSRPRGLSSDTTDSARYSPSALDSASRIDAPSPQSPTSGACVEMELDCERKCVVSDEVKVVLRHRNGNKIGHFWFHASFVEQSTESSSLELVLVKHEIDHAVKDVKKGHKKFAANFEVRLRFDQATAADIVASAAAKTSAKRPSPASQSVEPSPSEQTVQTKPAQAQPKLRSSLPQKRSEGSLFAASKKEAATRTSPSGKLTVRQRSKSDTLHLHSIATIGSTTSDDTTGTAGDDGNAAAVVLVTTPKSSTNTKSVGLSSRFFSMRKRDVSVDVATAGEAKSPSH